MPGSECSAAHRNPVMQVYCFPKRIVSWVERSTILIELVGEHQDHFVVVLSRLISESFLGCISIDHLVIARQFWDLTGCVDATDVKTTLRGELLRQKVVENGVS